MNWKEQFTFVNYYCPDCGEVIAQEAFDCSPDPRNRCPSCNIDLKTAGRPLLIVGIPIFIIGMFIMTWQASLIVSGLGLIFIVIGMMRVFDRVKAKRKFNSAT